MFSLPMPDKCARANWQKATYIEIGPNQSRGAFLAAPALLAAFAIAPVVVFLASDAARMVSGATYDVTGGDSATYAA